MPLYTMSTSGSAEKVSDVAGSFPVPNGTAVLNERLKGSQLHTALKNMVKVHLEGRLGCVDVYPSSTTACIYLAEGEAAADLAPDTRSRLATLARSTAVRGVVLVECGGVSAESFPPLQQAASVELSLQTIPVSSPDHAAKYIAQMVKTACVSDAASAVATPPPVDQALFHAVQCLPRTGPVKARQLLDAFHSLKNLSEASVEELSVVVGLGSAKAIHTFFHQPLTQPQLHVRSCS